MKKKTDSEDKKPSKEKGTIIAIVCHPEDAVRLKKAFDDGLLDQLGITAINLGPITELTDGSEAEAAEKKWASKRPRRRTPSPDDDKPAQPLR